NTDFDPSNYPNVAAAGNKYLYKWSVANADFFYGTGNGVNGGACSSTITGNLQMVNVGLHGFAIGFDIVGGLFSENNISALDFGASQQFLVTDNASVPIRLTQTATICSGANDKLQGSWSEGIVAFESRVVQK